MKREDHFRLLASVALIDGHLDSRERDRLLALARLMALRPAKAERILKDLAKGQKLSGLKIPKRRVLRLALFQDLVLVAAQDGEIAPQERAFLRKLAPHFGLEKDEVDRLTQAALAVSDAGGAPLPSDEVGALPDVIREVHAARDGETRAGLALRLLQEGEPLPAEEEELFVRLAARHKVSEERARELLAGPVGEAPQDPVSPRDQVDGVKAFGALAGLLRLKDLVEGEEDFLARLAARYGVGRVLLRKKLRLYVPADKRA